MNGRKYASPGDLHLPLLALIFLLCLGVLVPLFAGCWRISRETAEKNLAVQLCRGAAEAHAAAPETEKVSRALGGDGGGTLYYDSRGFLCPAEEGWLRLTLESTEESAARGVVRTGHFAVWRGESVRYSLSVSRYVPESERGSGA